MSIDLLKYTESGGCSAKIPARQLEEILKKLPIPNDPSLLVGTETHDDAAVYSFFEPFALVLTTDFFPPVCSNPYEFGQIAAANAISDIYAMGATPALALNIVMFPSKGIDMDAYAGMLRGGADKAKEAGVIIAGGHTIDDPIPKYGLAVVGITHTGKIARNSGAHAGCKLILTKPVGTGIILAAQRMGIASEENIEEAKCYMKQLNKTAAAMMNGYVAGCTDITGFGLAGHALKMARASGVTIRLNMRSVPLITQAYDLVNQGCIPGAAFGNLDYAGDDTSFAPDLDYNLKMAAFDAQTSGGLLIAIPEAHAETVVNKMHAEGLTSAAIIGETVPRQDHSLIIEN